MYFYGFFFIPVAISFILCLQLSGVYIPLNTLHTLGFVKDLAVKKGENLVMSLVTASMTVTIGQSALYMYIEVYANIHVYTRRFLKFFFF